MSRNSITPPSVKFELHTYGEVYDFSNSIDNWKDLEFTLKRDDTSGIYHQISFPFEFVKDAYDVVKGIYDKYQYRAVADMYIYLLKENWPYETEQYHEPQIFNLDWITYEKSDEKIEIDTKRTSLFDFIKAKKKIVYDIPVSELKEDKPWFFNRIELENSITMRVASDGSFKTSGGVHHKTVGISYETSEVAVKDKIFTNTVPDLVTYKTDMWHTDNDENFIEIANVPPDTELRISIDIGYIYAMPMYGNFGKLTYFLTKKYDTADPWADAIAVKEAGIYNNVVETTWKKDNIVIQVNSGDRLYLMARFVDSTIPQAQVTTPLRTNGTIKVEFQAKHNAVNVDLINPKNLLQSLVNKMTDTEDIYLSDIEDFNTDNNNLVMLTAAESIRGIPETAENEAEVHTSFKDFEEWMNAFGYEQHIDGVRLRFRKRNKGFRSDLTALELEENECAGLKEYVNADYLYSGLKIGYNRKDIENMNVRFEFNGQHDYATDLKTGENILELISPYRADCYGIEFLAQERGKNTTDDKADKDMFLVNVSQGNEYYTIVENRYTENAPNGSLFNGNLNPFNLMKLNRDLLGVSVKHLQFAASDSNARIAIDDQVINASYDIPEGTGLFEAHMYDIASKNIQHLPSGENVNGIVRFKYKGEVYEGYIDEISKNPAWETETTWVLRKRKSLV